jgi:hypothetical protein
VACRLFCQFSFFASLSLIPQLSRRRRRRGCFCFFFKARKDFRVELKCRAISSELKLWKTPNYSTKMGQVNKKQKSQVRRLLRAYCIFHSVTMYGHVREFGSLRSWQRPVLKSFSGFERLTSFSESSELANIRFWNQCRKSLRAAIRVPQ